MIGGLLASLGHGVTVFGSGHLLGSHNRGAEAAPTFKDNAAGSRVYIAIYKAAFSNFAKSAAAPVPISRTSL